MKDKHDYVVTGTDEYSGTQTAECTKCEKVEYTEIGVLPLDNSTCNS